MSEIWGAHTCWSAQDSSALDIQDKTTLQVCKQRLQVWRMTLEDEIVDPLAAGKEGELTTKIAGVEVDNAQDNLSFGEFLRKDSCCGVLERDVEVATRKWSKKEKASSEASAVKRSKEIAEPAASGRLQEEPAVKRSKKIASILKRPAAATAAKKGLAESAPRQASPAPSRWSQAASGRGVSGAACKSSSAPSSLSAWLGSKSKKTEDQVKRWKVASERWGLINDA